MRGLAFLLAAASLCPAQQLKFTDELWKETAPIYSQTLRHPFLEGLTAGTLPKDRFRFYLEQDTLYLRAFSQALNLAAAKAPREGWAKTLTRHAVEAIEAEQQLHASIVGRVGDIEVAPTNAAYTNHLLASAAGRGFTEALAALLPCYWIYWEVGKELKRRGSPDKDYQRWIDQYAGEDYGRTVQEVLVMMNEAAAQASAVERASAKRLFIRSARYEWMFWDMAWRLESWQP
jgi:thiaminase/transcriptional activator TenA